MDGQITLEVNGRYRAWLRLGFFEGIASNGTICDKLMDAGFVGVQVTGGGRDRVAEGVWPHETKVVSGDDLPSQIVRVQKIG